MTFESSESAANDFDFIIGSWHVHHRRLKERLVGCDEWTEFVGDSNTRKILGGFGNLEDNYLALPEGPYRAVALRSFNATTKQWSIWWLDGRNAGVLDVPVVGRVRHVHLVGLLGVVDSPYMPNRASVRREARHRPQRSEEG